MAKCNSKNKGHKFATGAALGADPVSLLAQAGIATHTATGNLLQKWARNDYEDLNPELVNALFTGENADQVIDAVGTGKDFSSVRNNDVLLNTWNDNYKIPTVEDPSGWEKFLDYEGKNFSTLFSGDLIGYGKNQVAGFKNLFGLNDTTNKYNEAVNLANYNTVHNFYNQAVLNDKEAQRQAMMNYFDNGGSLDGLNGITKFNVGGSHSENPYDGIQQGIASDGYPNLVEENEIKYKDYIYSARLKPSKSLLKQYNLPEKYAGLTFAEVCDKLQKESEDRPNDPISITTLDDWMSRLAGAQEEYKAKAAERKLAKVLDNMSTEEKAAIMSSLEQPMAQQESIDLSQPMYAKGGKIYIKPENRGKFTALKKRTGKSASWFKAHGTPAQKKMATFALNARKWKHEDGGHLFDGEGNSLLYLTDSPQYKDENGNFHFINTSRYPAYTLLEGNTQTNPLISPNIGISYALTHTYDEPNMANPIWRQGLFTETLPKSTPVDYVTRVPYKPYSEQTNNNDTETKGSTLTFNNLSETLRYAPAIGAGISAITAALQPKDFTLANQLRDIASEYKPVAGSPIGGYRKYTPYDINLGDIENIGLTARAIAANRGQNRATQGALNAAVISNAQKTAAQRNLAWQQANEANRLATDQYNLGIDQFNANRNTQYDQLNQQILANRLRTLMSAAQAEDLSKQAWANMYNTTHENFFNQLGNVGKDSWNRNQRDWLLSALGREGLLELLKSGYKLG